MRAHIHSSACAPCGLCVRVLNHENLANTGLIVHACMCIGTLYLWRSHSSCMHSPTHMYRRRQIVFPRVQARTRHSSWPPGTLRPRRVTLRRYVLLCMCVCVYYMYMYILCVRACIDIHTHKHTPPLFLHIHVHTQFYFHRHGRP